MNTQKQIFLIVVLFFMFVGACGAYAAVDLPIRAVDQKEWHESQSIERGALLFANNCRTCHGNAGQGGVGLPLNIDQYKDQDPLVLRNNRDKLTTTLNCGRAGTLMQPWLAANGGALNERQIEHLVNLITAPGTDTDPETGQLTNKGWEEAVEFAHNLNGETAVVVGGDTLDSIAKEHHVGLEALIALNPGHPADSFLKSGSTVKLPPTKDDSNGRTYKVIKDNETLSKIADSQHVGAIILAELNNIDYRYNVDDAIFTIRADGRTVPGLFPGDKIALPEGAVYVVKAGDTVESIAEQHGLTPNQVSGGANADRIQEDKDGAIIADRQLKLPSNAKVRVKAGDTVGTIATAHGLEPDALISANSGLTADSVLNPGDELSLPSNPVYIVQRGDTIESIVAGHSGVTAQQLASDNKLDPNEPLSPEVVLELPKVDAYVVKGQSLKDLADTFSNVTADELAQANSLPSGDAILRVGAQLKLPDTAWGSAPSDARNPGTACVQWAVPASVFDSGTIPGVGTPEPAAEKPTEVTQKLVVEANANDWTFVADGTAMQPNKGVVLIKTGTSVQFVDKVGLHTITVNDEKQGDDINTGQTRDVTFSDAGQFQITCDYHPAMQGTIFVE